MAESGKAFAGSIPRIYEEYLVPLIFEPYAADLAGRVASQPVARVLEIAAGTGAATRALARALPAHVSIVATDLNQAMIDQAAALSAGRPIEWRQADAGQLPFAAGSFDAVVCQFGAMFFPDRPHAFSEARRVLRPGGRYIFSVWDRIADNEFTDVVERAVATVFPADPPRFLSRAPHGYFDRGRIQADLQDGGFAGPAAIDVVTARSRAGAPSAPSIGFVQGTPLRNEIEARDASRLHEATAAATDAIARRFGHGAVDGKIQALVVTAVKA